MKIKQVLNEQINGQREVDYYVPINIRYESNNIDSLDRELFYYRFINKETSFVEMTVNSASKKIIDITVVCINKLYEDMQNRAIDENINTEIGNPLVDTSIFDCDDLITNESDFKVYSHNRIIYIVLDGKEIHQKVNFDGTELLLDGDNNIVGFIFKGFTDEEWTEMYAGIKKL